MTARWLPRLLIAYALVLTGGCAALVVWLSPRDEPRAGASEILSAWRQGALAARRITAKPAAGADPGAALAAERGTPGTTLVVEHVVREGRVFTLTRTLFGLSFVAGRDGVRATLNGRDATLTADDLLRERLYRRTFGVDSEGVLDRLANQLGCGKDELWRSGSFRRLVITRTVLPRDPPELDLIRRARQETAVTTSRLTLAIKDAGRFLVQRLREDGRFSDGAPAGAGYDWAAHAAATVFLAESGERLDAYELRSAARRAGRFLQQMGSVRCGPNPCIGGLERGDTGGSADTLLAYSELATEKAGVAFRGLTAELASFLRAQQRGNGGFFTYYDRARQRGAGTDRDDVDAQAVLALARAHRITGNPADLEAARRGLRHLTGRPGLLGARDYLGGDHRVCVAMNDLWERAADPAALDYCLDWTSWGALLQIDRRSAAVAEYRGGVRPNLGWVPVPDLTATAQRTEGAIATLAAAVRAGRSADSIRALDVRMAGGVELLLREQLPGARAYLRPDAEAESDLGGFTRSPVDRDPRLATTAAAGSALLRCLRAVEPARGATGKPARRRSVKH
jgi:hypothetical protein